MVTQVLDVKYNGGLPQWNIEQEDILRQYYRGTQSSVKSIQKMLSECFGINRTEEAIRHRAGYLGLTTGKHYSLWSTEQIEYLQTFAGNLPTLQIAQKLGRSTSAIQQICAKMNISLKFRHEWYAKVDVLEIFGISKCTLDRWIQEGKLKVAKQTSIICRIERKDLKKFICKYPTELTGRNVDIVQLVDLLCDDLEAMQNG